VPTWHEVCRHERILPGPSYLKFVLEDLRLVRTSPPNRVSQNVMEVVGVMWIGRSCELRFNPSSAKQDEIAELPLCAAFLAHRP
jgi:hypothetical protein